MSVAERALGYGFSGVSEESLAIPEENVLVERIRAQILSSSDLTDSGRSPVLRTDNRIIKLQRHDPWQKDIEVTWTESSTDPNYGAKFGRVRLTLSPNGTHRATFIEEANGRPPEKATPGAYQIGPEQLQSLARGIVLYPPKRLDLALKKDAPGTQMAA